MTPFLIIAVGLAGWAIYFRAHSRIKIIRTWPTAPAVITGSSVKKRYQHVARTHGSRRRPIYAPAVTYAYHVAGVEYRHDGISPVGWAARNPRAAQNTVERYPPGRECQVVYNPERPEEAFLEVGDGNEAILFAILGTVAIVAGLLLIRRI